MGSRLVPFICFLLLLMPVTPSFAQFVPAPSSSSSLPLELGFGPGSLRTLDGGIPVYTQGDELWVMNVYNSTAALTLQGPQGGLPKASASLASQSAKLLYAIPASAASGLWTLNSTWTAQVNVSIPIEVASSAFGGGPPGLVSAVLSGSSLSLNYSLPLGLGDDVQAVLSSPTLSSAAVMPIPASFGSGSLGVQLANDSSGATVTLQGSVTLPFAFWVELYTDYSFSQLPTVGYTTSPVLAARSQAVQVASGLAVTQSAIEEELSLRQGRYTMRAFFRSGSTVFVEETHFLLTGGGWIWMNPASERTVYGSSFGVTTDLAAYPWPTFLIVTYRRGGVGSYGVFPLGVTPSTVSFAVPPWEETAPDISVTLSPDASVTDYGVSSGTLYVIGQTNGFHLAYHLALGNHTFLNSSIDVGAGLSALVQVPLGQLIVNSTFDGKPAAGATVTVTDGLGGSVSHAAEAGGGAGFFLPSGSYNVTVVDDGHSTSQKVEVTAAQVQHMEASLSSTAFDLSVPLLAVAVFGVALNLWVWVYRPLRRVSRRNEEKT